MTLERPRGQGADASSTVLTIGEALAVGVPSVPVTLDEARAVDFYVGGAEVNFAVGLCRLGRPARIVGRVGEDSLGTMILDELRHEGVEIDGIARDPRPTGLYLREWLTDGARRPYYYRRGSAGSALEPADGEAWVAGAKWLHLTGITPALGDGAAETVRRALAVAQAHGVRASFDANYRAALWSARDFVTFVRPLLAGIDLLFVGEEEAELLFDTPEPLAAMKAGASLGVGRVVVRLGARGAAALDEGGELVHERGDSATAIDPVGAGDAFDAGFVAALLAGAPLRSCLGLGAYCGARVVEHVGEHVGAPRLADLPGPLRAALEGHYGAPGGSVRAGVGTKRAREEHDDAG